MTDKPHTIFMHVKTTAQWLKLTPTDRFAFLGTTIQPILKQHPTVKMRFYDSEFFSARISDVIVWETADLVAFRRLVDRLRETMFWGTYFDVVDIIASVENDYADSYDRAPVHG
jgi:hypothetical protein